MIRVWDDAGIGATHALIWRRDARCARSDVTGHVNVELGNA